MLTNYIYLIHMNKPDLALNNLQWLICHKNKNFEFRTCWKNLWHIGAPIFCHQIFQKVWLVLHQFSSLEINTIKPCQWGLKFTDSIPCRGLRPRQRGVLGMTLNCIWWQGISHGVSENVEFLFITFTPRSTLTRSGSIY